jgi:acyl-CoA carboxylase epsilon subunit
MSADITVTRGEPTSAELAAVLAVLFAARSAATAGLPAESGRPSRWAEHSRARAVFPRPGPHAWRASALPH